MGLQYLRKTRLIALFDMLSPDPHGVDNRAHFSAFFGQNVLGSRGVCVVNVTLDDAVILQHLKPIGQRIRGDARQTILKI